MHHYLQLADKKVGRLNLLFHNFLPLISLLVVIIKVLVEPYKV